MDGAVVFVIVLCIGIYFFPALIAASRSHANSTSIFVLNLLLGWTLIGWVIAIVWAFTAQKQAAPQVVIPSEPSYAMQGGTKACPFCAEQIKAAAKVCRFCNREQPQ